MSTGVADLRVLLVQAPGADLTRIAIESALVEAGGEVALTPAAANVMLTCGRLPERMGEVADRLWAQVPHPRVRLELADAADAERLLAAATRSIRDLPAQRASAERETGAGHESSGHGGMEMSGHGGMDMSGHGGMDMSGHGGMDMSGHDHMNMSGPGGIPLASGDEDRDGLEMDVLNRTLGPVLPFWDSCILVRVVLAGDTIRSAEAEILAPADPPPADAPAPGSDAVLRLDETVRFLRVAGWDAVGDRLTRARTAALRGRADAALRDAENARRRIRRSPMLRWVLRGLAVADRPLRTLLLDRVDEAILLLRGETPARTAPLLGAEELAALVTGRDLGTARLLVAAVRPDPARAGSSAGQSPADPAGTTRPAPASGGHHHG